MKLFIDSADAQAIEECYDTGLISGVTTNPSLIRKSGSIPEVLYKRLIDAGIDNVSMEVSGSSKEMIRDGLELAEKFGYAATIKVPMTQQGLVACRDLNDEGIRTNVTLIFNAAQAILAANAGATYVSPFVGRIDDQGYAGLEVVRSIASLYSIQGESTEVLAASIRTPHRAVRSFFNGAHIATVPVKVFWDMYEHILTDKGLEIFENDLAQTNLVS